MHRWSVRLCAALLSLCLLRPLAAAPPDLPAESKSQQVDILKQRIEAAIDLTRRRHLTANVHTPWQIIHAVKPYGRELYLLKGTDGKTVNAIEFLLRECVVDGQRIFQPTQGGYLDPIISMKMEGHPDQFLSAFAQSGVPLDFEIPLNGHKFVLWHLVEQAKLDFMTGNEASWTLIALTTYEPVNATWVNRYGQRVGISDIVATEVAANPNVRACGGTHNLYSLAYAVRQYRKTGQPLAGVWLQAAQKLNQYRDLTRQLQNEDGTLSSNYYEGRGWSGDSATQLSSTGHMIEWLSVSLSDEELREAWVTRAVEALVAAFERTSTQPVEVGALYHATRALRQYHERRFTKPESTTATTASRSGTATPAPAPAARPAADPEGKHAGTPPTVDKSASERSTTGRVIIRGTPAADTETPSTPAVSRPSTSSSDGSQATSDAGS